MTPRLTVGISFHNEARFLEAAVRSVLDQSFVDFELILVDDGSTDGSVDVARRLVRDERVRLIPPDGQRRHLPARLNEIRRKARGELIARMDADDLIHPDKLALQVAYLDREPQCDAIGTWLAVTDDNDERSIAIIEGGGRGSSSTSARDVLLRPIIPHATMVARTAWLCRYPYDETLTRAEDRDLWCRAFSQSHIAVLEDVLYLVHVSHSRPDFLPDYLLGHADLRRVVLRYGPAFVGTLTTAQLIGVSLLKSAAMLGAHRLGWAEMLVSRRGRAPTTAEQKRVDEILRASRSRFSAA